MLVLNALFDFSERVCVKYLLMISTPSELVTRLHSIYSKQGSEKMIVMDILCSRGA
jgi:hypothetical protein